MKKKHKILFLVFILVLIVPSSALITMKSSFLYKEGVRIATNNQEVVDALGRPLKPGFIITGSIKFGSKSGISYLRIPLKGSTENGILYIRANEY